MNYKVEGMNMDSTWMNRIEIANLFEILVSVVILLLAIALVQNEQQMRNGRSEPVMETEQVPLTSQNEEFDGYMSTGFQWVAFADVIKIG